MKPWMFMVLYFSIILGIVFWVLRSSITTNTVRLTLNDVSHYWEGEIINVGKTVAIVKNINHKKGQITIKILE